MYHTISNTLNSELQNPLNFKIYSFDYDLKRKHELHSVYSDNVWHVDGTKLFQMKPGSPITQIITINQIISKYN